MRNDEIGIQGNCTQVCIFTKQEANNQSNRFDVLSIGGRVLWWEGGIKLQRYGTFKLPER